MPYAGPTHKAGTYKRDYRREKPGDPFYTATPWRRLRLWFLRRHPLCANPHGIHTEPVPATEVDHTIPRRERSDLQLHADNLMALCKSCHSIKTATERRRAAVSREDTASHPPCC